MHTIIEPGDDRHAVRNFLTGTGFCQGIVLRSYFIEPGMILRRCGDDKQDRPPLVRVTGDFEFEAIRHIRDGCNVVHEFVMPDGRRAKRPAQESLWCRDCRVVGNAGGKHLGIGVADRIRSQYAAGQRSEYKAPPKSFL